MGGGTYWRRYGAYVIRALTALISIQKLINCAILERGAARRVALYQIITGKLKIDDINPQFINKYTWVLINKSSYTVVCSMQNPSATLAGKHIIVNWQALVSIRKYRQLPFYCRDPRHTNSLIRSPWKNSFDERARRSPWVIILLLLETFFLDYVVISLRENWCWSK